MPRRRRRPQINFRTEDVAERVGDLTGGAGVDLIAELAFSSSAFNLPPSPGAIGQGGHLRRLRPEDDNAAQPPLALEPTFRFVSVIGSNPRRDAWRSGPTGCAKPTH